MKTSAFFTDSYGKKLYLLRWLPETGTPRAVIQIVHGMAEHTERYNRFANMLRENGFAVFAHDHRGHGKTDPEEPGFVSETDGFDLMAENILDVRTLIEDEYPGLPRFFFGHSMGSFLVQRYMQIYEDLPAGIIYSGSNGKPPAGLIAGILVSGLLIKIHGPKAISPLLHRLTFGGYKRKLEAELNGGRLRTEMDWLTRDEDMVDLYLDDPLCGFSCSTSFYHHLFKGLKTLHSHKPFTGHGRKVPVLIISGDTDPVSNMGKGIRNLERKLRNSGQEVVDTKLYPGGRHEMLNETNYREVTEDMIAWIEEKMAGG